jgi:hypothetical protein
MSKKVKFIVHLKISCNYDGDIEFENDEEMQEKVTQIIANNTIWETSVEEVEVDEEEKENV